MSWETIELACLCCGIVLIILLTVVGNLIVLFAFFNDKHLLTPSNNFLLSMAIADLLVGLIGMPFYSYAQLKTFWPFGEVFCKIWITIDDVVTMASVLSIVAITIERYWSINHSVHYRRYTTKARIRIFSLLIWLIPFLNFAPGIWFLQPQDDHPHQSNSSTSNRSHFECIGAYHSHTLYLIVSQINFFAWPLVVIIVLNGLIVVNLYKRSHRFPAFASYRVPTSKRQHREDTSREQYRQRAADDGQAQRQHQQIDNDVLIETAANETNFSSEKRLDFELNKNGHRAAEIPSVIKETDELTIENCTADTLVPQTTSSGPDSRQALDVYKRIKHILLPSSFQSGSSSLERSSSKSTQTSDKSSIAEKSQRHSIFLWRKNSAVLVPAEIQFRGSIRTIRTGTGEQRTVRRLRRDKRAATSLFTLVLVFMIFLLPYVVVVVVGRIFPHEPLTNTNGQVYSASFWLLWLNSTVNPILYPFIQPRFREAYRRLFLRLVRRRRGLFSLIVDIQRNK